MNRLPTEILGEIFFQLHQHDQFECMRVCHHWKQVIDEFVLYNTVYIYSRDSLQKIIKRAQEQKKVANRIERLILCIGYQDEDSTSEVHTLLCLLQNLRALSYYMIIDKATFADEALETTSYPWLKSIEHISEFSRDSIAIQLLLSSICPNLATLTVDDYERKIIKLLKNAPALKTLTISSAIINVSELELLHQSLPNLKSLTFSSATLEGFEFNKDIRPAASITEFSFNESHPLEFQSLIHLLVYISKKYSRLLKLSYSFYLSWPGHDSIKRLNEYGWTPLFQRLGSQLKKLCISRGGYLDRTFFEKLDRFNCQIQYLKIYGLPYSAFSKLAQSQQVFHIQTLVLSSIIIKAFDWLKELVQLKKLKLINSYCDESSNVIKMNDIIDNSPPTLRSLSLEYGILDFDFEYTGTSHIETLSLHWIRLPRQMDTLISRCFPQLSKLKLSRCHQLGKAFDLGTLDMSSIYFSPIEYHIMISTSHNNERRRYFISDQIRKVTPGDLPDELHMQNYIPFKTWPENESSNVVDFTLICNSVKNLVFVE